MVLKSLNTYEHLYISYIHIVCTCTYTEQQHLSRSCEFVLKLVLRYNQILLKAIVKLNKHQKGYFPYTSLAVSIWYKITVIEPQTQHTKIAKRKSSKRV